MKPIRTFAALTLATGLVLSGPALAYDVTSLASPGGMQVEAWIEGDNRLVIGLIPNDGNKLNAQLGVAISGKSSAPWSQDLPLVVTEDGDYFEFPFSETVSFDPDALDEPTALTVEYGTCQLAAAICVFEETEVTVHPGDDGAPWVSLTNVMP